MQVEALLKQLRQYSKITLLPPDVKLLVNHIDRLQEELLVIRPLPLPTLDPVYAKGVDNNGHD